MRENINDVGRMTIQDLNRLADRFDYFDFSLTRLNNQVRLNVSDNMRSC